jgi:hypothetical protein
MISIDKSLSSIHNLEFPILKPKYFQQPPTIQLKNKLQPIEHLECEMTTTYDINPNYKVNATFSEFNDMKSLLSNPL